MSLVAEENRRERGRGRRGGIYMRACAGQYHSSGRMTTVIPSPNFFPSYSASVSVEFLVKYLYGDFGLEITTLGCLGISPKQRPYARYLDTCTRLPTSGVKISIDSTSLYSMMIYLVGALYPQRKNKVIVREKGAGARTTDPTHSPSLEPPPHFLPISPAGPFLPHSPPGQRHWL